MGAQAPEDVKTARIRSSAFNYLEKASESFGKGLIVLVIAVIIAVAGAAVSAAVIGYAASQAWQAVQSTVQSMEESGFIPSSSQLQQVYQQQMQQAYEVVGFVTLLLLVSVSYAVKYVGKGARLAWRGFSWLEGINAAPYSVEIRLGVIAFIIGSALVGVLLIISLWTSITIANLLASGNVNSALEFYKTTVSSVHWFAVTSWVVLALGGVITGYAFLRCAGICGVGQTKGGAVTSIIGFLIILFSIFLTSVTLAVVLRVIGLIVALVGFYKAAGGFFLV